MSWARFSPTTGMPAWASASMSASETYFVAATTVTCGPTSSAIRSYRSRIASGDVRNHSLPARPRAVAAVREEAVGVARRTDVDPVDVLATGRAERALDRRPEVEPRVADDVGTERLLRRRGDLFPDLVAARADRRADDGGGPAGAERTHALADHAGEQAAPADVEHGDCRTHPRMRPPRDRDRHAVGGDEQHRAAAFVGPQAVAVVVDGPRRDDPARARTRDGRAVPLPRHRRGVGIGADRVAEETAVLDDARRIVLRPDAEIERCIHPFAHTSRPRRERDAVG